MHSCYRYCGLFRCIITSVGLPKIVRLSNVLLKKFNKKVSSLSEAEKAEYIKYMNLLASESSSNNEELIIGLGFQSVEEYGNIIKELNEQVLLLNLKYPEFSALNHNQKLNIFKTARESEINAALAEPCVNQYNSCKGLVQDTYMVAVVGCVVAGGGSIISAGCIWVVESAYDDAMLSCRYDYMTC